MITFATLFWQANQNSFNFSSQYDESWVEKLYLGFKRNTTREFEFVVYTDRKRDYRVPVTQEVMEYKPTGFDYGDCIRPYARDCAMILVGLDTVITGNIDHLVDHCLDPKTDKVALPKAVYKKNTVCNGVALIPPGLKSHIYDEWNGENDMDWLRTREYEVLDDLYPGQIVSYKGHVKEHGLGDARIVFFHGKEKPDDLQRVPWIKRHWRGINPLYGS